MACCEKLGKDGFRGIEIDIDNIPDWYKEFNSLLQVPTLKYNDLILKDSISIVK